MITKPTPDEPQRSECLALGQLSCTFCFGLGMRPGRAGASTACNCVWRAIFRRCYDHLEQCRTKEKHFDRSQITGKAWGLQDEEFTADFCLIAKRKLTEREYRLFWFHYLCRLDWKRCCQRLGLERGEFFFEIYRIEQKLGETFRDAGLFPIADYYSPSPRKNPMAAPKPISPPLRAPIRREGDASWQRLK